MTTSPRPASAIPAPLAAELSREFLLHHRVCPKELRGTDTIVVAAAPDALVDAFHEVAFAYRRQVEPVTLPLNEVERLIERLTTQADRSVELERIVNELDQDDVATDVRDLATQPPVVRYVNLLVRDAYDAGASDIHLESTRTGLAARFRLDGVLVPAPEPPNDLQHAVISRIKLLAELDIAERRRPQDGRIRVRLEERELDLRISTVPTMFGESVVLRLLDRGGRPVDLTALGMSPSVLRHMELLSARPHGMLLVTGPTGSGKTTTLYAALRRRDVSAEKIITVEEPVEYQLAGVTQVPVQRQAGVSFASALRSILRQDPDVVMIGEMRDPETAGIAVQAAMTGHMVLSTLHTNDALSAVPRLIDLQVPEYLVAATIEGVLSQRLVRRICPSCQSRYSPDPELVSRIAGAPIEKPVLTKGVGCHECRGTGYRGRLGIFELMVFTEEVRWAVTRGASASDLKDLCARAGTQPMAHDGWIKVQAGLTTAEEVARVC
jgi:general secretion pathway protein E